MKVYRSLVLFATALTFALVVVGAFVRLSDAGLGCPDWPGCYGEVSPAQAQDEIARAVEAQGGAHGPVSLHKAWKEMIHRYIAGALGLLLLAIAIMAWVRRDRSTYSPWLATSLVGIAVLQAALGMWTVTLLLKPVIVTLHLLGGMTTLALLVWLSAREWPVERKPSADLSPWLRLGLALTVLQIALGGWVSSNYAALACTDLPTCRGEWLPPMDFRNAFHLFRELGMTPQGELLSHEALTAIHWLHRVGAVAVAAFSLWLGHSLLRRGEWRDAGIALLALVTLQFTLGVLNVLMSLPLPVAAAHNAGAALLLALYAVLNFATFPAGVRAQNAPA